MSTGIYGPRVIGNEKFKAEQETVRVAANIYGPRIVGAEAAARARGIRAAPPAATGQRQGGESNTGNTGGGGAGEETHSLREITTALQANPALLEGFLRAETQHRDKPRISVLRLLRQVEQKRDGGPRQEIVDEIDAVIAKLENA